MGALVAGVALVGVLCVLNLLLTFGVIRRLREHTELIAGGAGSTGSPPSLPVGQRVADFTAATTDGETVDRDLLTDETLVAFVMPGCGPCKERLPDLVTAAGGWAGGRERTLAVVVGDPDQAGEYVETLAPVARVVVTPADASVVTAFKVTGYPLFGVVDGSGTVRRSARNPVQLWALDAANA